MLGAKLGPNVPLGPDHLSARYSPILGHICGSSGPLLMEMR